MGLLDGFLDVIGLGPPDPPDMSGVNNAAVGNVKLGRRYARLAERAYRDQQSMLKKYLPLLQESLQLTSQQQGKDIKRSDQQWQSYLDTWKPVEDKLAETTLDMANPQRYEAAGAKAAADTMTQFDRARDDTAESLAMAGASPEKIATLEAAGRLAEAKAVGGARAQGRTDAESRAIAYLDNAARFGRNMPSTGIQVGAQSNADAAATQGGYGAVTGAVNAPYQATMPLMQGAVGANNSAGSLFGNAASLDYSGRLNSYNATLGALTAIGRVAGMGG